MKDLISIAILVIAIGPFLALTIWFEIEDYRHRKFIRKLRGDIDQVFEKATGKKFPWPVGF